MIESDFKLMGGLGMTTAEKQTIHINKLCINF